MPVTFARELLARSLETLAPPPQPMSSSAPSWGIFRASRAQAAKTAWEPPFIPLTIILPQNPSGLRVLLKILLRSPIVAFFYRLQSSGIPNPRSITIYSDCTFSAVCELRRLGAYCGSPPQKMKAVGEISCGLLHKWRDKFLHIGNKDGFYFFFICAPG